MGYGPQRGHLANRKRIRIVRELCVGCQLCMRFCPVGNVIAIDETAGRARVVDPISCGGCYACVRRCPNGAIKTVIVEREGVIDYSERQCTAPGQRPPDPG